MAWRDDLSKLKQELAETRAERLQQAAEDETEHQRQLERLTELASSLGISTLLAEMNEVLLDGAGQVETFAPSRLTPDEDVEEDDEELFLEEDDIDEDADVYTAILSWEEDGEREIAIDLGVTGEGFYLQVNGQSTRQERRALEQALLRAFREELEV